MNISLGDEGFIVQSAYRIYQGETLYKEVFSGLTPVSFYLVAFFMELFGPTFLAGRLVALCTSIIIVLLSSLILYRLKIRNPLAYLLQFSFYSYFVGLYWYIPSHHWIALAFCLGSFLCLLSGSGDKPYRTQLVLAGVLAAGVALTMQHLGALWGLAAAAAFLGFPKGTRKKRFGVFIIGYLAATLPAAAYFLAVIGPEVLYKALIVQPLTRYHTVAGHHSLEFRYLFTLWEEILKAWPQQNHLLHLIRTLKLTSAFAGILIVHLLPFAGIAGLVYLWKKKSGPKPEIYLLAAFFIANYLTALNRIADTSLVYASPAAIILLALLYSNKTRPRTSGARTMTVTTSISVIWIVLFSTIFFSEITFNRLMPKWSVQTPAGTIYSRNPTEARTLQGLTQEFDREALDSGQVYFYPYSPMMFFLLHARNPTPYDSLVYPLATMEQIEEVRNILEEKKTRWIVLNAKSANDPLFGYLISNYRFKTVYDDATILERSRP